MLSSQIEQYVCQVQGVVPKGAHGRCKLRTHRAPLVSKRQLHDVGCSKPFAFWARAIHLVGSLSLRPQDVRARQVMADEVRFCLAR